MERALIYQAHRCGACHVANGVGTKVGSSLVGSSLDGLGARRSRECVIGRFLDPEKCSSGTIMPPYRFASGDMEWITDYLVSLP
ncbi:MAG: hypothetical protein RMK57_08680 [Bryobacterales bacterium]|nr:cytochrome c [Bryobacteraceae bacterium]MDW8354590.1 hypothetical protein [Bryobacterales bacterium]